MKRTLYFALIVVAVVIGYDLWTLIRHGYDTTISNVALVFAKEYPIIVLPIGIVIGHIYWTNKAREKRLAAALERIADPVKVGSIEFARVVALDALQPAKMEQV